MNIVTVCGRTVVDSGRAGSLCAIDVFTVYDRTVVDSGMAGSLYVLLMFSLCVTDVLETLMQWVVEGLDLDAAIAQPETAYKVRHLKMGVRLSDALCSTNSDITLQIMVSFSS